MLFERVSATVHVRLLVLYDLYDRDSVHRRRLPRSRQPRRTLPINHELLAPESLRRNTILAQRLDNIRDDVPINVVAPDNIEVLVPAEAARLRVALGELMQHDVDVDERVRVAIEEDDRADDVARGEAGGGVRGDAGGAVVGAADEHDALDVVVVHLELGVAHDLEPVHDGLDGRGRVEVREGGELLERRDVLAAPVEEPAEGVRDRGGEDGRVEEGLPGGHGGHDGLAPEDEENERRTGRKAGV